MPTRRNFTKRTVRCGPYEAQDVLLDLRAVDLDCLELGMVSQPTLAEIATVPRHIKEDHVCNSRAPKAAAYRGL